MWKPGSMGHDHGWHFGQAHEMIHELHQHAREWHDPGVIWRDPNDSYGGIPDMLGSFISSFAERMGEKAADAVTGTHE